MFYGLDWVATVPPTINISRQIFGLQKSAIIYGWIFASHQAGAAVAAYGGGLVYNYFNTYTWAFFYGRSFLCVSKLICHCYKKTTFKSIDERRNNDFIAIHRKLELTRHIKGNAHCPLPSFKNLAVLLNKAVDFRSRCFAFPGRAGEPPRR